MDNTKLRMMFTKYILVNNHGISEMYQVRDCYKELFVENPQQKLIMLINGEDTLAIYLEKVRLPGLVLGEVIPFDLPITEEKVDD